MGSQGHSGFHGPTVEFTQEEIVKAIVEYTPKSMRTGGTVLLHACGEGSLMPIGLLPGSGASGTDGWLGTFVNVPAGPVPVSWCRAALDQGRRVHERGPP